METKTGNRVIEIQTSFWVMGPTIFELWDMETRNPNTPLVTDILFIKLSFKSNARNTKKIHYLLKWQVVIGVTSLSHDPQLLLYANHNLPSQQLWK